MGSFELRSPLYAYFRPYDHCRPVFEAVQNPQIGLQGELLRSTTEYRGESSRTAGYKAVESSSAGNGPHKRRPDRSDYPRSKNAKATPCPSGAQSQVDADLQAALDSIFPPPDQEVLYYIL